MYPETPVMSSERDVMMYEGVKLKRADGYRELHLFWRKIWYLISGWICKSMRCLLYSSRMLRRSGLRRRKRDSKVGRWALDRLRRALRTEVGTELNDCHKVTE